jgi:hypothetical protein
MIWTGFCCPPRVPSDRLECCAEHSTAWFWNPAFRAEAETQSSTSCRSQAKHPRNRAENRQHASAIVAKLQAAMALKEP